MSLAAALSPSTTAQTAPPASSTPTGEQHASAQAAQGAAATDAQQQPQQNAFAALYARYVPAT